MAHDLRGQGGVATEGAAELADDAVSLGGRASIQMDVLADEGRAPAVGATMTAGLQGTDAAAEKDPLQLFDMA